MESIITEIIIGIWGLALMISMTIIKITKLTYETQEENMIRLKEENNG